MSALPHAFGHLLGDCQSLRKALQTLKIRTLVASGHPTGTDRPDYRFKNLPSGFPEKAGGTSCQQPPETRLSYSKQQCKQKSFAFIHYKLIKLKFWQLNERKTTSWK